MLWELPEKIKYAFHAQGKIIWTQMQAGDVLAIIWNINSFQLGKHTFTFIDQKMCPYVLSF